MKKIFYTLLVVLTCFIGINRVSASVYDIDQASATKTVGNVTTSIYSMYRTTYQGSNVWTADFNPVIFGGSTTPFPNELNFYLPNFNACGGDDITIAGHIYGIENDTSTNGYGSIGDFVMSASNVYNGNRNQMSCVISKANNNVFAFNCSGKGGKSIDMHFTFSNYTWTNRSYYFGIYSQINYSCEMNSAAIIQNQNENTQSIINSQNSNTQSIINSQNEINKSLNETNDTLKDDDTSESASEYSDFFTGFSTNNHGLTGIITAPLELIGNIAGSSCSPLPLQVPFVNKTFSLPCMSTIYKKHFGSFFSIYQTTTFGLISYWVMVKLFALIKGFKNPANDEIEVMDL